MKLIIVDDEELTREGLIASINWEKFGIDEIYQADDGINGLELAKRIMPDLIICDVRMPRLDGIHMLDQIKKFAPDAAAIFMSGFSDKEYLKAAIRLQAVNYIEKPIEPKEMEEAIGKAIEQNLASHFNRDAETMMGRQVAKQLAFYLTMPYQTNRADIERSAASMEKFFGKGCFNYITPVVIRFSTQPETPEFLAEILASLNEYTDSMKLHLIYTEKHGQHVVIFIYGEKCPARGTTELIVSRISGMFSEFAEYYMSVGNAAEGLAHAYEAYSEAVVRLQNAFFCPAGTVLWPVKEEDRTQAADTEETIRKNVTAYRNAVRDGNEPLAMENLEEIYGLLCQNTFMMPNQARGIYYDLLLALAEERERRHLMAYALNEGRDSLVDEMNACFDFEAVHGLLKSRTEAFFGDIKNCVTENATIRIICDYIAQNYQDAGLSVKSISDHAGLSASYACTFFKNETGTTLNQYITDFRMRKAKQLLADPRNRISEISALVGYNDGNYFGKSFKKYTGMTPSEFKEQAGQL